MGIHAHVSIIAMSSLTVSVHGESVMNEAKKILEGYANSVLAAYRLMVDAEMYVDEVISGLQRIKEDIEETKSRLDAAFGIEEVLTACGEQVSKKRIRFGDWVVYDPGYTQDIGRAVEFSDDGEITWVCFSTGCTAASCASRYLRLATEDEIAKADKGIGFHRFDEFCPEYDDACCAHCRAKRTPVTSCKDCANGEYHGYPPEGSPEWEVGTVYFWCPLEKHHDDSSHCNQFKAGTPKRYDKHRKVM